MEWGQLTLGDILKGTGILAVPFLLGKWLWNKAVTEEIQKVGAKADAAKEAAIEAKDSVEKVPGLLAEFSGKVADDLSKMSLHYADSIKSTQEAKNLVHNLTEKTDRELDKQKMFSGKFAKRLRKVEEDVSQLKIGKVIVTDRKKP